MTAEIPTMDAPATTFEAVPAPAPRRDPLIRRAFRALASALDWLFGFAAIIIGLAALSVVPILNFLSLGYMLHASGRVAATGKLRAGFVGIRKASAIGNFIIG